MQNLVATVHDSEMLLICGDLIGHNGKESLGYEGIHGRYGFENWNVDGERILEFVVANNLFWGNSKVIEKDNHLITYQSGNSSSQIDYILLQHDKFNVVKDINP